MSHAKSHSWDKRAPRGKDSLASLSIPARRERYATRDENLDTRELRAILTSHAGESPLPSLSARAPERSDWTDGIASKGRPRRGNMAAWAAVLGTTSRAAVEELDHQVDSGMGSSDARSPEVKSLLPDDEDDDEEDESLAERLLGLTEMFPEPVRNFGQNVGTCLCTCIKGLYAYSCSATWLVFSSSTILFAPIIFEMERAQMEDLQRTQQKQVLLGPNTALSGVNTSGLPMAPPVQR